MREYSPDRHCPVTAQWLHKEFCCVSVISFLVQNYVMFAFYPGVYHSLSRFSLYIQPPILLIMVLEDMYGPPFSIHTKKVPVALHLTLQWRLIESESQKVDFTNMDFFSENRLIFQIFAKTPRYMRFWWGFG